ENARGKPSKRHGCCIKQRFTQNQFFRLLHIRKDFLDRLFRAGSETSESKRCSSKLHKISTAQIIPPFRCAVWKFTMKHFLELFGFSNFFETSPILLAVNVVEFFADRG